MSSEIGKDAIPVKVILQTDEKTFEYDGAIPFDAFRRAEINGNAIPVKLVIGKKEFELRGEAKSK